jgi:hypothetical protein
MTLSIRSISRTYPNGVQAQKSVTLTSEPMPRISPAVVFFAVVFVLAACRSEREVPPAAAPSPIPSIETTEEAPGFLYGRITTYDGATFEGRLRWGGDEEAFWGHYFNGFKDENRWAALAPLERLPRERRAIEIFGVEFPLGQRPADLGRPFMVRYGDIARIEAHGDGVLAALESKLAFDPDVRVTLKSGAVFDLDRLEASDFDDGVRVWDGRRGIVDLGPRQVHTIELLPTPPLGEMPDRLHGTVRTRQGDFTGFLQWDREEALGSDELVGRTAEGEVRMRFDTIRSIARHARDSSLVTLSDGREVALAGTRGVGLSPRGIYVDDRRYGRVLISWDAFERADFSPGGSGPAYGDFPPGRPVTGHVTTRTGSRLAGRLVYDLDESETTETLDAPAQGVDYTVPFGLVASIVLPGDGGRSAGRAGETATVVLRSGEGLELERMGDLSDENAGMLVFIEGREQPEYVPWKEVARVDFDRPPPSSSSAEVSPRPGR